MAEIDFKQEWIPHLVRPGWRTRGAIVLGTVLVGICAHIAVPLGFTPIPITMQTFAVLLLGLLLGPGGAFFCLALYLGEGLAGMPVFSPHGPGGIAQLLGPTGGYLLSYPFAAACAGALYRLWHRRFWAALAGAGLSSLVILAAGATWLTVISHANVSAVFSQSVAPFLAGDAIKVLAAAVCATILGSFNRTESHQTL